MQKDVVCLWRDQTVAEAATVLDERGIGGAPVCDRDGKVLGILTKSDIAECAAREDLKLSVERAMMPEVISVGADEPLERAISIMAFEGVHRLAVLDAESRLAGLISSMDVLRELAGFGRLATRRSIARSPIRVQNEKSR
ncbi:MAG: CBS domain-containing protein [Polyangiaceae bacterium]|nr:CBS domain-containing protein [Polyangiaceae bacterium]